MPALLRSELTERAIESQHRSATVGFVEGLSPSRAHGERTDSVADTLDEVMSKAQESSEAEAVTFLASDMDEGGTGSSSQPACRRAGRTTRAGCSTHSAAWSMHRCRSPSERYDRGHVYTGEIGTSRRSAYAAMGDSVNVAARLMAKAP